MSGSIATEAEFALIDLIRGMVNVTRSDVVLGIGDDGAITRIPDGHDLVTVTDTMVAGVHFPNDATPFDIGWKALAVNLSDCAAMAARPVWASLALTLPSVDRSWCEAFASGFAALAKEYHVALIGGDTTRGPLTVTVTVQALVARGQALKRKGARVGDALVITGPMGLAAAGLACWQHQVLPPSSVSKTKRDARDCAPAEWLQRLHRPMPRLDWQRRLSGIAHAGIDISDGLLADVGHMAKASNLDAVIDLAQWPLDHALQSWFGTHQARQMQLSGGDDYELALAVAPQHLPQLLSQLRRIAGTQVIGAFVAGHGAVRVVDENGAPFHCERRGYQHFQSESQ